MSPPSTATLFVELGFAIARFLLAVQDEERHVVFGLAHLALGRRAGREARAIRTARSFTTQPVLTPLRVDGWMTRRSTAAAAAVHVDHPTLRDRLAAMSSAATPRAHRRPLGSPLAGGLSMDLLRGHDVVVALVKDMDDGRRANLQHLGFDPVRRGAVVAPHRR